MKNRYLLSLALFALVVTVGLGLLFALSLSDAQSVTPRYGLSDRAIEQLGLTSSPDLVPIRISRVNLSPKAAVLVGVLVWLPVYVAFMSFLFLIRLYKHLKLDVFGPALLAAIGVLFMAVGLPVWGVLLAIVAFAVPLIAAIPHHAVAAESGPLDDARSPLQNDPVRQNQGQYPWRLAFHIFISTALVFLAVAMSLSTHILLTSYHGFKPGSQVDPVKLRELFQEFTRERVPPGVLDEVSWRIDRVPSLNDMGSGMTIFSTNRLSIIFFIAAAVTYMIAVWVIIIPIEQNEPEHRWPGEILSPAVEHRDRILFALGLYLSVGFAFAMLCYNIYVAAAAKQNVMTLYAEFMQLEPTRYRQLLAATREWGPTESLVRQMLQAATHDDGTSKLLAAARARYWPSAVIAQEMPRYTMSNSLTLPKRQDPDSGTMTDPGGDDDTPAAAPRDPTPFETPEPMQTKMTLDPIVTLADMLYFSFVSFTTTGYGDIRPVSNELRLWTVVENVVEVLFTSMFFVVAFKSIAGKRGG